jgi:hypothetical protein
MMDSSDDNIDGRSGPADKEQEVQGQEAPGHDYGGDATNEDLADDKDDDDSDKNPNSATDNSIAHPAAKRRTSAHKSSSQGKSNKRPRHDHIRDNDNVKGSDNLIIEWDALADGPSGDVPLTRYIPCIERDNLLGWATHITQPTTMTRRAAAQRSMENNNNDDDESDQLLFDPLAGLPNVPLPPSMLFLLHEAAAEHLLAKNKNDLKQQQPQQKHKISKINNKPSNNNHNIFECFDLSALVALGMVLEESITASLLPLARVHVARCRRLEEQEQEVSSKRTTAACARESRHSLFKEWTLLPAEAVAKLQVYDNSNSIDATIDNGSACTSKTMQETALPSTRPPNRNAAADLCPGDGRSSILQLQLAEEEEEKHEGDDALDRWCRAHGLERDFVLNNMDIFGSLVSSKKCPPR